MPIFRWGNAFDALLDVERELDRMVRTVASTPARVGRRFPALNLLERTEEYLVVALLPGVDAATMTVEVAQGVLSLSGERSRPEGVAEAQYRRTERPFGRFERTVSLPERVDEDAISADLSDGVLRLRLPKQAPSAGRRIEVSHRHPEGGERLISGASGESS